MTKLKPRRIRNIIRLKKVKNRELREMMLTNGLGQWRQRKRTYWTWGIERER